MKITVHQSNMPRGTLVFVHDLGVKNGESIEVDDEWATAHGLDPSEDLVLGDTSQDLVEIPDEEVDEEVEDEEPEAPTPVETDSEPPEEA